jgi:hypothetical protein
LSLAHAAAAAGLLAAAPLAPLPAQDAPLAPWRVVTLPQQAMPATRYRAVRLEGREALAIEAEGSYGNLVQPLAGLPAPARLAWAWRLERANPGTDLRQRAGDDTAVKVCLAFDLPLAQVPFVERQLLRLARSRSAEPLPAATLCWAWGGPEARGELLDNAYTRRVRTIVLRNAQDAPGTWHEESRDIAADFARAFGAESRGVPPLLAVIVSGDADNTGASTLAHLAALRFEAAAAR